MTQLEIYKLIKNKLSKNEEWGRTVEYIGLYPFIDSWTVMFVSPEFSGPKIKSIEKIVNWIFSKMTKKERLKIWSVRGYESLEELKSESEKLNQADFDNLVVVPIFSNGEFDKGRVDKLIKLFGRKVIDQLDDINLSGLWII